MSSVAIFVYRKFESTFVFTFTSVVFKKVTFTFYSSSFFCQTTFTFTQVVLRAITFTFTQVPKKVTRLNTENWASDVSGTPNVCCLFSE